MRKILTLLSSLFLCTPLLSQEPTFNIHAADSIQKGIELNDEGEYDKALHLYNMVHPGDTNYSWAVYEKCLTLANAERYDEALKTARKGIALTDSSGPEYFNIIGTALDHTERQEEALEVYQNALQRFPINSSLHFNQSVVYQSQEDYDNMLATLKTAVEYDPFHASSHLGLAGMALDEEEYAQGLLSVGYFLMIEPRGSRANATLVKFNNVMMGDHEPEPKDIVLSDPADDFKKINLLLKNKAALRNDYKVDSDIELAFIKQLHLAINQSVKKKELTGFWENYYIPFYKALIKEGYFEVFSYYILLSSGNEDHIKTINKNANDIKEFLGWANAKLKEVHGKHPLNYRAGNEEVKFWFFDDSKHIKAIGNVGKDDQPVGDYIYYYTSGCVSSKGAFNSKSELEGTWRYYHDNGSLSAIRHFEKGEKQGEDEEYFKNGYRKNIVPYKDGDALGIVKIFEETGALNRLMYYEDGSVEDSLVYFYANGTKDRFLPMTAGNIDGKALYYYSDGKLMSEIDYKEDLRSGKFVDYYHDQSLSGEGGYLEGKFNGPYVSYHPNGKLDAKGDYAEGSKIGAWEYYYFNGNLRSKSTYDEKGKENGVQESFDKNGLLTDRFVYSKGEVKEYYQFDRKGEIIHQDIRKFGKFWYEGYSVDGVKTVEGNYLGDHKGGLWKYYTDNGDLYLEEYYNDDGELHGLSTFYYSDGTLKSKINYENGQRVGYEIGYFHNGKIEFHGYNVDGERNGIWRWMYHDGTHSYDNFYVNGKVNGPQYYYDVAGDLYMIKEFDDGILLRTHTTNPDSTIVKTHVIRQKDGSDSYYFNNGQLRYQLNLTGGDFNGEAKWYFGNGELETEGHYINDQRHGEWKWYFPGGALRMQGQYMFGSRTGVWKEYYENGQLEEEYTYENGKIHGTSISYWENGRLQVKGVYDQGERNGQYIFYDHKGQVNHIRHYEYGRIIGFTKNNDEAAEMTPLPNETGSAKSFYPNGKPAREYNLENGRFVGKYFYYHDNGQKAYEANYVADMKEGPIYTYYENGTKKSRIDYMMDDMHGEYILYWPNGKMKLKGTYLNDSRHGIFEHYDESGNLIKKMKYYDGDFIEEV